MMLAGISMAEFLMKIAGHTARVESLFESTRDYFRSYLCDGQPDFSVTVTRENLLFEQQLADEEAREEGFRLRRFTDPFLERAAIQRAFAEYLFDRDILLFHGSLVAVDGQGYLFTARSGTGKSTHTRLWCQVFGDRAVMVNDDKPFLQIFPTGVTAWGSPWSGKHGLDTNLAVPLRGICLLERGAENRIRCAAVQELLPMLLHECCPPLDPGKHDKMALLAERLARQVPLWRMTCTKEPEAAAMAYDAMSGGPFQASLPPI